MEIRERNFFSHGLMTTCPFYSHLIEREKENPKCLETIFSSQANLQVTKNRGGDQSTLIQTVIKWHLKTPPRLRKSQCLHRRTIIETSKLSKMSINYAKTTSTMKRGGPKRSSDETERQNERHFDYPLHKFHWYSSTSSKQNSFYN